MVDQILHEQLLDRLEVELALRGRSLTAGKREQMRTVLVRIDRASTPQQAESLRKELERELLSFGGQKANRVGAPDGRQRTTQCT